MKKNEKREYYIVDKRILPNSIQSVIKVNDLVQHTKISKYEAIKKVGISRSTYYKYKDFVFSPSDSNIGRKALISIMLEDKKGALSEILNFLYSVECNIITINQNIPINEVASIIISMDISDTKTPIEEILVNLKTVNYVVSSKLVALE